MRSAHRQHQQHGVQADKRGRPAGGVAETPGRARNQHHRAETRGGGDRLERPQPAGESQRGDRVACEREQRAVRGVLKRPPDEREDGVGGRFGCKVRIGIQSVQGSQPRERQITEHVLGDQRWPEQQDRVRHHDRARECGERQPPRRRQHQQVARAHEQHQCLEAAAGDADIQAAQRPRHPRGPAAATPRDVLRWPRSSAGADQEDRRHDAEQPERAEGSHDARRCPRTLRRAHILRRLRRRPSRGYGGGGLYEAHCCVSPTCERPARPIRCGCSRASGASCWAYACAERPEGGRAYSLCDVATAHAHGAGFRITSAHVAF